MTNEDAIERLEDLQKAFKIEFTVTKDKDCKELADALDMAIKTLSTEKTAEWIIHEEDDLAINDYQCSKCDYWTEYNTKYCPNCGRKMKGAEL